MSQPTALSLSFYSSPSSEENETFHGTPATKLTDFSPEEVRVDAGQITNTNGEIHNPPLFALPGVQSPKTLETGRCSNLGAVNQDPFRSDVSSPTVCQPATPAKLSATAQTFQPRLSSTLESTVAPPVNQGSLLSPISSEWPHTTTAMGFLRATSVPDSDEPSPTNKNNSGVLQDDYGSGLPPIGPRSLAHINFLPPSNFISPDSSPPARAETRCIKIGGVRKSASADELNLVFMVWLIALETERPTTDRTSNQPLGFLRWSWCQSNPRRASSMPNSSPYATLEKHSPNCPRPSLAGLFSFWPKLNSSSCSAATT